MSVNINDYLGKTGNAQADAEAYRIAKAGEARDGKYSLTSDESIKFVNKYTSGKSNFTGSGGSSTTTTTSGSGDELAGAIKKSGGIMSVIEGVASFANKAIKGVTGVAEDVVNSQLGSGKGTDYTTKMLDIVKRNGIDVIGGVVDFVKLSYNEVMDQLKQQSSLFTDINSKVGISGQLSQGLRDDMIEASKEGARYGITLSEIGDFYTTMSANSGKFALINQNIMESAEPVSMILGKTMGQMGDIMSQYENVGMGVDKTIKALGDASLRTVGLGLNARKVTEEMTKSIGNLNSYGFQNGVQGLERMSQRAVEFKMSMGEVFKLADNVFTPEKAVDLSASLQVLGGAMGDFNDPIKLMYMATNNVEGLQDALIGATEGLATYNQEQGRFEITGLNLRKAQEMAKALGVDYKELTNSAIAGAERMSATNALMSNSVTSGMDEKDKEFLINMSRMEGGEMKIVVPKSLQDEFGKQTEVSLDSMTKTQAEALAKYQKENQKIDTKELAMSQLTYTEQMARGIDVIATYYKIQGARFATGLAKGATAGFADDMKNAIEKFSKEKSSTTSKDAEKSGVRAGEIVAHPIDYLEKKGKEMWNKITGNESTTQPTTQKVEHIHTFNPTNPVEDGLQKAISRDNSLLESWTSKSKNDLTTPQVAHKN